MGFLTKLVTLWAALRTMLSIGATLTRVVFRYFIDRTIRERQAEIDKASEELKKANEVEDDEARLKAKADAACKLEKLSDPDSDCDR